MTGAPEVLFVGTNRKPRLFRNEPSFIYRCENLGLALRQAGVSVAFAHISELTGRERPRVAVFLRPLANLRQWLVARRLRGGGVKLLADFDDLIFDDSLAEYSPGVVNGLRSLFWTRRRFRAHGRTLAWFDGINVSTSPLAEHVARLSPDVRVCVVPNCVHLAWRQSEKPVCASPRERVITYFPGTRSHDRDFALVAGPLSSFLRAHPAVRLHVTGPLEFGVTAHPGQIRHRERLPFDEYRALVQMSWLNLAPLEDTPFNRAKSALKVLEAGYWGIPTLCSPNADVRRFTGAGAVLAEHSGQWSDALERMLDADEYHAIADGLREKVVALADVHDQARQFTEQWL